MKLQPHAGLLLTVSPPQSLHLHFYQVTIRENNCIFISGFIFLTYFISAMMVHNADPNNMPPPPYQHYFMEQHILGQRQAYENVAHAHNQHYLVPQPPSPTEQIPISFTSPLPKPHSEDSINSMVSEHRTSSPPNPSQYYVPYNPPSPPYHSTGYLIPSLHAPISPPLIPPPGMETHQPFQHRPCPSPPLRTTSNLQDSLLSRMNPNHVYDEIVMPQRTLPPRPPVPPRPSRSQSRSPPQSPIEEGWMLDKLL